MTADRDVLVVASLNWRYGGIDPDGSKDRWQTLTEFLDAEAPDVILCQEFQAATPSGVHRHFQDTASELRMTGAVLGPPARRDPPELTPSGTAGGRGDRAYATPGFAAAVSCRQVRTGATDHDALVLTIDVAAAATAGLPGALT